jgi:hypothetical protein
MHQLQSAAQRRWLTIAFVLAAVILSVACGRQDARIEQHKQNLESFRATTKFIGEAWLSGDVSGTYTRTALEQTFHLVEQERAKLASTPEMLRDRRGAALSQGAEQLSRLIASMIGDVGSADGESARQRLASLPIASQDRP